MPDCFQIMDVWGLIDKCSSIDHEYEYRKNLFALIFYYPAHMHVLGICTSYKYNQSVDIGETLVYTHLEFSKRLTSATNRAYSVQHACALSTTPTPLAWYYDRLHMLKLNVGKGRQIIKTAMLQSELQY